MTIGPSSAPPDLVKYRLLDEIGHGGMATVYRALDVRLNREVAVKLMHPHLRDNTEAAARFVAEARAVAQLRHQGIVEIYDVSDEEDDERFLVAQLVRGPSLRKLVKEHEEIPAEIAACLGLQLCEALGHAHDNGIIHRDVKPENVLLEVNESRKLATVKLTDFGIAKVIDAQGVTSTGQVLGSPAHMAPEQIDGGSIGVRTDIFSLGVLVYECMVGHLPFEGKNPAQVLRKVLDGTYPEPDRERPKVGSRWAAILARAIAREPDDRWTDVREFAAAMRQELEAFGIADPRAEVYAYLSDPDSYVQAFSERLVEALKDRAEEGRRRGDTQSAAADLNRAVAYAPDDQHLLHQLTSLASGLRRREMLQKAKRVSIVLAAFAALGTGAFLFARWVRIEPVSPSPAVESSAVEPSALPTITASIPAPRVTRPPQPSATPTRTLRIPPMHTVVRPPPSNDGAKAEREVRITAHPGTALVSVDGSAPVPVGFELVRKLPVGPHSFTFSLPQEDDCCEARTVSKDVVEGQGPQQINGGVRYRDARLSLVGGPPDAKLECFAIGKTVKNGETVSITMIQMYSPINCFLSGSGIPSSQKPITLRAGRSTPVTP
jgi:eukaryotic-like serine/threonine-protein kinase